MNVFAVTWNMYMDTSSAYFGTRFMVSLISSLDLEYVHTQTQNAYFLYLYPQSRICVIIESHFYSNSRMFFFISFLKMKQSLTRLNKRTLAKKSKKQWSIWVEKSLNSLNVLSDKLNNQRTDSFVTYRSQNIRKFLHLINSRQFASTKLLVYSLAKNSWNIWTYVRVRNIGIVEMAVFFSLVAWAMAGRNALRIMTADDRRHMEQVY